MEVTSGAAVNQGLIGMQKSQAEMVRSAQYIAQTGQTASVSPSTSVQGLKVDLVDALVNLKLQAQIFDSSAKVVKSADNAIGRLLDAKA